MQKGGAVLDNDTLYWFFSTIAQTYGATLGVLGMFSIYRLQSLYNKKENCRRQSEEAAISAFGLPAKGFSPEDLQEKFSRATGEEKSKWGSSNTEILHKAVNRIDRHLKQGKKIRNNFFIFMIINLFIIVASIILLPFSEDLLCWKNNVLIVSLIFILSSAVVTYILGRSLIKE